MLEEIKRLFIWYRNDGESIALIFVLV